MSDKYSKARYDDRKRRGMCVNCGAHPPQKPGFLCRICKEAHNASLRRTHKKYRAQRVAYSKAFRERMIREHRCRDCTVPLPEDYKELRCTNCAFKASGHASIDALQGHSRALVFHEESTAHRIKYTTGRTVEYEINKPASPDEL